MLSLPCGLKFGPFQNGTAAHKQLLTSPPPLPSSDMTGFNEKNESNISVMVKKLEEFQLACKRMPKARAHTEAIQGSHTERERESAVAALSTRRSL